MRRADSAVSGALRAELYVLIEIRMQLLLYHLGLFRLAWEGRASPTWPAFFGLLSQGAKEMGLSPTPIPIIGDSYESTGLFVHYDTDFRNSKDYFFVKMDASDPPIYWPLAFHELSHCWLSRSNYPDQIYATHHDRLSGIESEVASNRIEEALCDVLSTRVVGPAYCISYLHKFWTLALLGEDEAHPTHAFRLECMSRTLEEMKLFDAAAELRETIEGKLEPWADEPVSPTIDSLVAAGRELFSRDHSTLYQRSQKSIDNVKGTDRDVPRLFLSAWLQLDTESGRDVLGGFERVNATISRVLEGWSEPSEPKP